MVKTWTFLYHKVVSKIHNMTNIHMIGVWISRSLNSTLDKLVQKPSLGYYKEVFSLNEDRKKCHYKS